MDSFDVDDVKAEKANAVMRYRRLRKIGNLFRFIEVCAVVILLFWFSTRLPIVVRMSGAYFRELSVVLVSPRFVFLVGNAIIITLFAKSGQFSGQTSSLNNSGTDLYDEFVRNTENRQKIRAHNPGSTPEGIEFHDKEPVTEESTLTHPHREVDVKIYRRSQSQNLKRQTSNKPHRDLRRSETEKCPKVEKLGANAAETSYPVDDLSNEEFQRTVEAFIARQQKFLRDESMAIILSKEYRR